jgi:hypothetical protein
MNASSNQPSHGLASRIVTGTSANPATSTSLSFVASPCA